ncbi:MAG TPA: amino acid ABC transporter permease [Segeticoccus sp.]|uniref:amino acid ABC transporter permease n=1 Tax=Segeticoccus sp. TaxID=2706531 RepID=UPI002D803A9A|nr:amino acid ABC transporter permease [Segeticoccus sp.]HET8599527.1 amino acid ABC transporter permease [Segeticoccus sp.]
MPTTSVGESRNPEQTMSMTEDAPAGRATTPTDTGTATRIIPVRHYGTWVLGAVVLVLLGILVRAFAVADIQYSLVFSYLTKPTILGGVANTLKLTVLAMVMGLVLGVITAVMRQTNNPVLRAVAAGYTWLFRGTPLLVQLLIWFNLALIFKHVMVPGLFSFKMNDLMTPFVAALLGLGVNEGAYIAEIVRGGILSVDEGQREAGHALGMRYGTMMRRIVLPQALRVIVPPLGNEFIALLKFSALAYTISYGELLFSANKIYTANFKVIELLFTASIWYLILTTVFTLGQQVLERRLNRGRRSSQSLAKTLLINIAGGWR